MLAKLFSPPLFCADICVVSVLLLFVSELFVQATNINAVAMQMNIAKNRFIKNSLLFYNIFILS
jgi:hypothetical protein